jgi:WD40 repeat protein
MRILQHGSGRIMSVAYAPDGKVLASAGFDDLDVKLWDLATGKELQTLRGHKGMVLGVAFSPDGRTLASCSGGSPGRGEVLLWDLEKGRVRDSLLHGGDLVHCVEFAPDGRTLAAAGAGLWDLATRKVRSDLKQKGRAYSVAYAPDGRTLAAGGRHLTTIWDVAAGVPRGPAWKQSQARCVAYAPDGKTLASGLANGKVKLWDVARGEVYAVVEAHKGGLAGLAFLPDGCGLVTGGGRQVKQWQVPELRERASFDWQVGLILSVAVAPDGMTAAAGSLNGGIAVWDLE